MCGRAISVMGGGRLAGCFWSRDVDWEVEVEEEEESRVRREGRKRFGRRRSSCCSGRGMRARSGLLKVEGARWEEDTERVVVLVLLVYVG